MVKWIRSNIGTASYEDGVECSGISIIDVRDIIDRKGNQELSVMEKIDEAVLRVRNGEKIVICCDYGMSRSNAIAVGVLVKTEGLPFIDAVRKVLKTTGEKQIKVEMLSIVRSALEEASLNSLPIVRNDAILVTGGTGAIGTALVPHMKTFATIFSPSSAEINVAEDSILLDIFVKEHNISTILHLAGPHVYSTNKAMGETLLMLRNVIDVCLENRIKLIYISSWEIYSGYKAQNLMANETLSAMPKGVYGETKYLCERLIEHHAGYGLDYAIVRSSPVYGSGDRPKFIYNFIEKALSGCDVIAHKYLNGFPHLDMVHIDDLVSAMVSIIKNNFSGKVNIGSGKGASTTEVADLIIKILSSKSRVRHKQINDFAPNIIMDISFAIRKFGWNPQVDLMGGLIRQVEYYKNFNSKESAYEE
ncbi:MAG: NAD-dependent epimerase/dehydratase family protein [Candidatus Omnitrophota bacterium]